MATKTKKVECPFGDKCKNVGNGTCYKWHPICKRGIDCKPLKQRKCKYYHPSEHFPDELVHTKLKCQLVKIGKCSKDKHPLCRYGIQCKNLKKLQCNYYHPPTHFPANPKQSEPVSLQEKPAKAGTRWDPKDDDILLQHINNNPKNAKNVKFVQEFATKLKRTRTAIEVRIAHLIRKKKKILQKSIASDNNNSQNNETEIISNCQIQNVADKHVNDNKISEGEEQIKGEDIYGIGSVSNLLDNLSRYYKKENNNYEVGND